MAKRELFLLGPLRKSPILPPGVARAFLKLLGNFFRFEQFLQLSSNSEIPEQLVRWPTTVTAKPKTSRQKQNTARQNRKPHGKNKNLKAKPTPGGGRTPL